jgi:hypothetical protein
MTILIPFRNEDDLIYEKTMKKIEKIVEHMRFLTTEEQIELKNKLSTEKKFYTRQERGEYE